MCYSDNPFAYELHYGTKYARVPTSDCNFGNHPHDQIVFGNTKEITFQEFLQPVSAGVSLPYRIAI